MADDEDRFVVMRGGVVVPCKACIYCNHFDAETCAVMVEEKTAKKK